MLRAIRAMSEIPAFKVLLELMVSRGTRDWSVTKELRDRRESEFKGLKEFKEKEFKGRKELKE